MNTLRLSPKGKITLTLDDPNDWPIAENLCGSVKNVGPGVFEYSLGPLNLQRTFSAFTGPKKPKVTEGQWLLDKAREELIRYNKTAEEMVRINAQERLPLEPNGKFNPFGHQTKIVAAELTNPYSPVLADCGTGKTGSTARAIEVALERKRVKKGKILISAPLSILETSWMADIRKFTDLNPCLLWLNIPNRDIMGEEEVVHDFGPKPTDTVSVKTRTRNLFKNDLSGAVLFEMTALDRATPGTWVRYKAKVKTAYNSEGRATPFGEVKARTAVKEETKNLKVQEMLSSPDYDLFVINHDGVKTYQEILKAHGFEWVIVDESTKIKNSTSGMFRAHIDISWKALYRTILTGTINPNGFIDTWAQFYFLDRGLTLGSSLKDFLHEYFTGVSIGKFGEKDAVKYVIRSQADRDRLVERIRRISIILRQRDCVDLPPRTDLHRTVRMTGEQEKAYVEMENLLVAQYSDRSGRNLRAEAVNILSQMTKLRQITSGYLPSDEGIIGKFKSNPKLEDLDDLIDDMGDSKIVVACQFKEEIREVLERYKSRGANAIYGDVSVKNRNESIKDFQTTENTQVMVLQPAAAAHGLTLTKSSHLIFLSLDYNFEYYYQTAKRIERIGQENPICVIHSLACLSDGTPTIDHDLVDVLSTKATEHNALFGQRLDTADLAEVLVDRAVERVKNR